MGGAADTGRGMDGAEDVGRPGAGPDDIGRGAFGGFFNPFRAPTGAG